MGCSGIEVQAKMQSLDHNLAAYLGDGPADSSVLRIFHRVLAALDAIYAAGSSHPPLSPETIRLDDSDQPHIQSSNRAHETADTVAFGSAKYSAPEACLHNGDSACCEIVNCYVLGFIFYEILIGKRSFIAQFASLENGPPSLWLKWHADKTVKARPLSELRPNLGYFAVLVDGMMEKDPSKRINSISQVLRAFSSVEAQTAYNAGPVARPPVAPKARVDLVRERAAFAANWLSDRLAAFRKPRVAAGALLAIAILVSAALLIYRESLSPRVRQPVLPTTRPAAKPAPKVVASLPSAPRQNAQIQPLVPIQPEFELQIESHLKPGALLFVDDLRPMALSQNRLFTEKITPGLHKLRVVTDSKAFLRLPLNIGVDGDISFFELPKVRSLRYVMLVSNARSIKVYGTPEARARLAGEAYEPVPEEGRVIASDQVVNVSFGLDPKAKIHLNPLPTGSIRIVLEPGEAALLVPIEISANVPDADIVINGEKLRRKLDNGVRIVRLSAGEYRVRLVHANYQDSAEQDLVISTNDHRRHLQFTLVPIVSASNTAVSSVPALGSATGGGAAKIDDQATRPFGKITFHIRPDTALISARREDESQAQNCVNNQPCLLRAGAYEVTAKAEGFKAEVNHIAIGAGDDKPYEWKLEAVPSASTLNPADFFENGQTWTVDPNGWWTHTQPGYSFMRTNQGIFVFDILKPSGLFVSKNVLLVVNYKGDGNRVLYTIDEHKLRRNERAPGIQADYSAANEIPPEQEFRLKLELSADRVIIRNAAGQILDNLPLTNAANGKVGFSGKLKLRVIQARYSQYPNSPAE